MSFTRNNLDRRSAALVLLACGGLITACSSMAQDHSSRSAAQAASSPTTVTTITNPGNGTNRITRPLHNLADHPAEARIMLILSRFA